MGTDHTRRFWNGDDDYHDLVEEYDRNIETTSPAAIHTRLGDWPRPFWSKYMATEVTYREYRGPRILNL